MFYQNIIDIIITLRYYKAKEGGRAMAVTEAQKKATAKYEKENYDKVLVRFPKGTKELIQKSGASSINGYIIKCVLDSLATAENK